jgi:hypothetical protein
MEESAVNLYQINEGLSDNGVDGLVADCHYAIANSRVAKLRRRVTLDDLMLAINCYPAAFVFVVSLIRHYEPTKLKRVRDRLKIQQFHARLYTIKQQ